MPDIQRYLNMVTSQHQNKPKLTAWLSAQLSSIDDVSSLADVFNDSFDLELAAGSQLDILGIILGIDRMVKFQPTGGASPLLDDIMYRLILKAKILQNQWDGTVGQLYEMWSKVFTNAIFILQDGQNMAISVLVIGLSSQMEKDLTTNGYILPKPQGVSVSFSYSDNPFFAYGLDTTDFKGYSAGYWAQML